MMAWSLAVIGSVWRNELVRYLRERSQRFGAISRTLLWLLILGAGLGATVRQIDGVTYAQYVLPGVMMLNVLFAALQSAVSLARDRDSGFLREVAVSPAPTFAIALGKVMGGATVATIQGAFPLLLMPLIGANIALWRVALGLLVLFVAGFAITAVGVVIASRLRSLESFGAISNGVIQPLFFLSGAIFPLGASVVVGEGEAFWMRVPMAIEWLMRINPIGYMLDVLRFTLYGQSYLPLALDTTVVLLLPPVALWFAVIAHRNILRGDRVAHRASMDA